MGLHKTPRGNINILDILFVVLLFMGWFFMANAWKDSLANTMLAVSAVAFVVYLMARFLGAFSFLELSRPFWTITAIISIPIWMIIFAFVPAPASSFQDTDVTTNFLETFVSKETSTHFLQEWLFPITESVILGILAAIFVGIGQQRAATQQKRTYNIFLVILLLAAFMSMLHISVIAKLSGAGVYTIDTLFAHQFLTFGILLLFALVTPFGMPALIAPHMVKNALVYGSTPAWIALFVFFIAMDFGSLLLAQKKSQPEFKASLSKFVP